MSVKIRLRRTGRKKQPSYRLVVADTNSPRDGQYLDSVGTYNPLTKPADLRIDLEKVDQWLAKGAGMSDTVASLIRKARQGGDGKVAVRGVGPEERAEAATVAAAPEPSRRAAAKPGSRGAPRAEAPAEAAEAVDAPAAAEAGGEADAPGTDEAAGAAPAE